MISKRYNWSEYWTVPIAARLATIDLARAFPTDNVVFGSLFGGGGGCAWSLPDPCSFLGKVEYCLDWFEVVVLEPLLGAPAAIDIDITEDKGDALVEHARLWSPPLPLLLKSIWGRMVTTVNATRSPDFRIRFTTVSWLACLTSSPFIWKYNGYKYKMKIFESHHGVL